MAFQPRGFGQPFTIPFDDEVITDRDLEWYDGERLIINVGEAATFTATGTTGGTAIYTEDSESGLFDIYPVIQDEFIAEGETTNYEIWDAEGDIRVRVKGLLRRLPAAPASEVSTPGMGELVDESGDLFVDENGDLLEAA